MTSAILFSIGQTILTIAVLELIVRRREARVEARPIEAGATQRGYTLPWTRWEATPRSARMARSIEGDDTMFARAVDVQFQPGKVDEASRIVQDGIVPVLKEQKGFKGQLLLTQRDTGKAISLNLWETEADLTAFETQPLYRELMGKLAEVLAGPPAGERYDVSVQA